MAAEEMNSTFDVVPQRQRTAISMRLFAAALLAVAAISPADGLGVNACMMRATMDLPCPGCGVTRGMTLIMRGRFAESWDMHPLAGPILVLLASLAGAGLLPRSIRARFEWNSKPALAIGRVAIMTLLMLMAVLWAWRLFESVNQR